MTDARLVEEGGRAHFMTRRFDRSLADKIHTQTLCAIGHLDFRQIGANDYAQLFLQMEQLELGPEARAEAFLRMVFNVAAANCDDHTKNLSFLLKQGGIWQLAPAYDVTHAYATGSRWTRQHLMAVNGKTTGITRADVFEVGDRFQVPSFTEAVERVLEAASAWPTHAESAGLPEQVAEQIAGDIEAWSHPLR
jgi:serine/threonine-protein kinase HipA